MVNFLSIAADCNSVYSVVAVIAFLVAVVAVAVVLIVFAAKRYNKIDVTIAKDDTHIDIHLEK